MSRMHGLLIMTDRGQVGPFGEIRESGCPWFGNGRLIALVGVYTIDYKRF